MTLIPKNHPRARSLYIREKLVKGFDNGLVAKEGLMAHGRGETFDYLIGEKSTKSSKLALKRAAILLLTAKFPIISVNGNVAALCPKEIVQLSKLLNAGIEINLFYSSKKRKNNIKNHLQKFGAKFVFGLEPKFVTQIRGLESARRNVDKRGIFAADVVLIPLEDGDRTIALKKSGKTVITFDLNPLSRTAQTADVTIVDNIVRGIQNLTKVIQKEKKRKSLKKNSGNFDNKKNLEYALKEIQKNLKRRLPFA